MESGAGMEPGGGISQVDRRGVEPGGQKRGGGARWEDGVLSPPTTTTTTWPWGTYFQLPPHVRQQVAVGVTNSKITHERPPPAPPLFRSAEHSVPPLGSRGWLWRGWVSSAGCRSSFALGSSSSKTSGSVASAQCVSYGQSRPGWIHPGCLSLCAQCRPALLLQWLHITQGGRQAES